MNYDLIIAIDPGKAGGIVIHNKNETKAKKMPSYDDLCSYFEHFKESYSNILVIIEKLNLRPQDTGGKQFYIVKMLKQAESLLSAIKMYGFDYIEVAPITWQKGCKLYRKIEDENLNDKLKLAKASKNEKEIGKIIGKIKQHRKNRYKEVAQNYYPKIKVTLSISDALLILHHARIKLSYDKEEFLKKITKSKQKNEPKMF